MHTSFTIIKCLLTMIMMTNRKFVLITQSNFLLLTWRRWCHPEAFLRRGSFSFFLTGKYRVRFSGSSVRSAVPRGWRPRRSRQSGTAERRWRLKSATSITALTSTTAKSATTSWSAKATSATTSWLATATSATTSWSATATSWTAAETMSWTALKTTLTTATAETARVTVIYGMIALKDKIHLGSYFITSSTLLTLNSRFRQP